MTILDEIFSHKRAEVASRSRLMPLPRLLDLIARRPAPLDFNAALRDRTEIAVIAEVKRGSPSKGILIEDFDPLRLARQYAAGGASAISVLTDEKYFGGSLDYLAAIADLNLGIPLLRKEFICDPYQIFEARAFGADAVLLIAASLTDHQLRIFADIAHHLGLAALVEIHNRSEAVRVVRAGARLVGINNRDLRDFSVDLGTTRTLRPYLPAGVVVVTESGIAEPADVADLNVDAMLIGEALVRSADIPARLHTLATVPKFSQAIVTAPIQG